MLTPLPAPTLGVDPTERVPGENALLSRLDAAIRKRGLLAVMSATKLSAETLANLLLRKSKLTTLRVLQLTIAEAE